jgi:hypothetical protein
MNTNPFIDEVTLRRLLDAKYDLEIALRRTDSRMVGLPVDRMYDATILQQSLESMLKVLAKQTEGTCA